MAQGEHGRLAAGLSPRRVLIVAAIFIVGYFGITIAGNAVTRHDLARDQERLRQEISALEQQQRRLDALREYMKTDEFIERAARDEGLVRPGDIAVVVAAPTPPGGTPVPFTGPWWERYFGPAVGPR
ncbi:MAG: septum formation initiator family protein [Chloroflexi bacterium]|nr:septum formation initiator family protein [Chloroflexota bacterium]